MVSIDTDNFIKVTQLTKQFGKKQALFTALDNLSFAIPRGATVAIIGKSGSGKSTLMHMISGLDTPTAGNIVIDGQDIAQMKKKQVDAFRAQTIGFVFQSFFVQGNETCAHNVGLPLEIAGVSRAKRRERVYDALKKVDLLDKKTVKARNLSGGQKQRLAIARALVNHPPIVFADEPTGNLDSMTGHSIEELLFSLNKTEGTTLIIVTHDQSLADKCQIQLTMKDGKLHAVQSQEVSA